MSYNQPPPAPPGYRPMMPPPAPVQPVVRKGFPVWLALVLAAVMGIGGCTVGIGIGAAGSRAGTTVEATAPSTEPTEDADTQTAAKPTTQPTKQAAQKTQPSTPAKPAAPKSEPAQPPAPELGTAVPFEGRQGKGTLTIESAEWKKRGLIDPDSGNYLVLDVIVRGTEGTVAYNPFYFKVQDADGREYNVALFGASDEPSLKSGSLKAGKKARGYIAFDVKKGPVTVTVSDELLQDVASIDIKG